MARHDPLTEAFNFIAREGTISERISGLSLEHTSLSLSLETIPLIYSYGIAEFHSLRDIEQAIEKADAEMYARKRGRKSSVADNHRF